jgi:hypothetical protein
MFRQWIFYGHRHRHRQGFFENLHETGITVYIYIFFLPFLDLKQMLLSSYMQVELE